MFGSFDKVPIRRLEQHLNQVESLISKYSGDNDTIIGAPFVRYADLLILGTIKVLISEIQLLQQRMNLMEQKILKDEESHVKQTN
ncbi:MAG: hypothetical protein GYA45_11700 [Pelolinea sp.]|nr:hypothetical protein [Pelolinea sp.]